MHLQLQWLIIERAEKIWAWSGAGVAAQRPVGAIARPSRDLVIVALFADGNVGALQQVHGIVQTVEGLYDFASGDFVGGDRGALNRRTGHRVICDVIRRPGRWRKERVRRGGQ